MARMMIKAYPGAGFDGVFRAGRKWPASGTLVETTSKEKDEEPSDGKPLRIGTATLAALKGDGRISFQPEEDVEDVAALKDRIAALEAENADLKGKLTSATGGGGKSGDKGGGGK